MPADSPDDVRHGFIAGDTVHARARSRAPDEIVRLLDGSTVRDRATGVRRAAQPADIAILFRSRDSHRDFEKALERRGVSTYVYKGLGFFDADEIQDAVALLRYLADPLSICAPRRCCDRASSGCRTRRVATLGRDLAGAIARRRSARRGRRARRRGSARARRLRGAVPRWLALVDRVTPSDLLGRRAARNRVRATRCAGRGGGRRART